MSTSSRRLSTCLTRFVALALGGGLLAACGGNGGGSNGCAANCLVTLASGQVDPSTIAVGSNVVFWAALDPAEVSAAGGAATTLASSTGGGRPVAVALDATHAYWAHVAGAILKTPFGGGTSTTLATG